MREQLSIHDDLHISRVGIHDTNSWRHLSTTEAYTCFSKGPEITFINPTVYSPLLRCTSHSSCSTTPYYFRFAAYFTTSFKRRVSTRLECTNKSEPQLSLFNLYKSTLRNIYCTEVGKCIINVVVFVIVPNIRICDCIVCCYDLILW